MIGAGVSMAAPAALTGESRRKTCTVGDQVCGGMGAAGLRVDAEVRFEEE